MNSADTNVLVRLIARDDPHQTASAEGFVKTGVWVSVLALAEAVWVFESFYKRTPRELAETIEMLLFNNNVVLEDSDAVRAALELFRARPSLGFTDCLILELARKSGHLPLGTFDRNLAKLDGAQKL